MHCKCSRWIRVFSIAWLHGVSNILATQIPWTPLCKYGKDKESTSAQLNPNHKKYQAKQKYKMTLDLTKGKEMSESFMPREHMNTKAWTNCRFGCFLSLKLRLWVTLLFYLCTSSFKKFHTQQSSVMLSFNMCQILFKSIKRIFYLLLFLVRHHPYSTDGKIETYRS